MRRCEVIIDAKHQGMGVIIMRARCLIGMAVLIDCKPGSHEEAG
jgi:hypothetical protein